MKPRRPSDDKDAKKPQKESGRRLFGDPEVANEFARQEAEFLRGVEDADRQDYSDQNLSGKELVDAEFVHCNCRNTNFSESNLRGADFTGATLMGANFCGASLGGADLTDATLTGMKIDAKTKFNGVKFFTGKDADGIIKALGILESQIKLASGPKGKLHEGSLNQGLLEKLKRPILDSLLMKCKEIGYDEPDKEQKLADQEKILKAALTCKIFTQPTSKKSVGVVSVAKSFFKADSKAAKEIRGKLEELDGIRKGNVHKF